MVGEVDGMRAIIHEDLNYNSTRIQLGSFTRSTLGTWPYTEKDYIMDTGPRGHVGVPLPLHSKYKHSKTPSELKDFGILDAQIFVKIPYSPNDGDEDLYEIDISFLMQRGFSKEDYYNIYNLFNQKKEYEKIYEERVRELEYIENIYENESERIAREIRVINERKPPQKDIEKFVRKRQLSINELRAQLDNLDYAYLNREKLKMEAEKTYQKQLNELNLAFTKTPLSIYAKMSSYSLPVEDLGDLVEKHPEGGVLKSLANPKKISGISPPYLYLTDPVTAYKLIMNPEIHGKTYIDYGDTN
jgi:hypothetical protein